MESFEFNVHTLCGENKSFLVWDEDSNDFGQCFQSIALISPVHALLAIASAYYVGAKRSGTFYLRPMSQKVIIVARFVATLLLVVLSVVTLALVYTVFSELYAEQGLSLVMEKCTQALSWSVHAVYVVLLMHRVSPSPRGLNFVVLVVVLVVVVNVIRSRAILFSTNQEQHMHFAFTNAIINLVCLSLYLLSLLPSGEDTQSQYEELISTDEREPLLSSAVRRPRGSRYSGFHEPVDQHYLGVARTHEPCLSKLFLSWVNPLIVKGRRRLLGGPDDVFDIPVDMSASVVGESFWTILSALRPSGQPGSLPLAKALTRQFGKQFLKIGALKLIADCAGLTCPILVNQLLAFVESPGSDNRYGYGYAIGLMVASLTVALTNCHFNFFINELNLKVRAAMVTAVYRHTLSVSPTDLKRFSTGEIVNAISTDVDRIVNLLPSLHALWSLPFQFGVTLYLLYGQVGISSLGAVIITLLLIPLNKLIADRIGKLSTVMMKAKDERIKILSEMLLGIRVIKFFSWEQYFTNRVQQHRSTELRFLRSRKYLDALCVFLWATTPVLISAVTFSIYVFLGNPLTATRVFTAVALFAMLNGPLNAFPWVINGLVEAAVSIKRVRAYLSLPVQHSIPRPETDDSTMSEGQHDIVVDKATFSYAGATLRRFEWSLHVKRGEFVGVIGPVGCGKSSLLRLVIGELPPQSGQVLMRESCTSRGVGYVQQQPWLQKGTVRDNILFGKLYQPDWYDRVVRSCALQNDFSQMNNSDLTDVGERGEALSGGQMARVALARAVYQNKDVYILDDIFAAVDVPVGEHIYRECILGLLKHKTILLCTHHPRFLMAASKIVRMDSEGNITEIGSPQVVLPKVEVNRPDRGATTDQPEGGKAAQEAQQPEKMVLCSDAEQSEVGQVKLDVYKKYCVAVGPMLSVFILLALLLMQASRNASDIWLAKWVSDNSSVQQPHSYLLVYCSIGATNSLLSMARAFLFAYGGICAAKKLHTQLLQAIIHAKVVFFDTTPLGRILNRFASDMYTVDDSLPFILNIFLAQLFGVVGHVLVCVYAVPWILVVLLPLAYMLYHLQHRYRPASRDIKRISSVALSPIYSHFADTLSGLGTIKAMKASARFQQECLDKVEASQRSQFAGIAVAQWLELRLQLIGVAVVSGVAVIAVIEHESNGLDPGLVGLAISYALGITSKLSEVIATFTETEKELVSVERCCQYIRHVPREDLDSGSGSSRTPYNWPSDGVVEFKKVHMRYRDHLPWALKDVSLDTRPREKVGVVGRTGSGKSSLFHVLFRTFDIASGRVSIDGVDTRILSLRELRRHLTIIPQQPFLFSGTIRDNLDPLSLRPDDALWDALAKAHMKDDVNRLGGLSALIEESGRSMSCGQRQLLCLARALLTPAKIVCVDEATANVDMNTDKVLQEVLRRSLCDCTVITIAHRVVSVLGTDRVVVMNEGNILETGHPNVLLQNSSSAFSKLVSSNSAHCF